MNNKLYVGNLDFGVTSEKLGQIFSEAGTVSDAVVITDKYSGRSRGFGFVTFETAEMADEAIKKFDGQEIEGRKVVVNKAREKTEG